MRWLRQNYRPLVAVSAVVSAVATAAISVNSFNPEDRPKSRSIEPPDLVGSESPDTGGEASPDERVDAKTKERTTARSKEKADNQQLQLIRLYKDRDFEKVIEASDTLFPNAGFRTRATVHLMRCDVEAAWMELDLERLRRRGYPGNIKEPWYLGWNSLSLADTNLLVHDQEGSLLASFLLREFSKGDPGYIWTSEQMRPIRELINGYGAKHPYCCLIKFLLDGYAPGDYYRLIEVDLLTDQYHRAANRLNLLRLVDFDFSFTEVEVLTVTASLIQGRYESARHHWSDAIGSYDPAIETFFDMALNYKGTQADFRTATAAFESAVADYWPEKPFNDHDGWFEQPVLEKWLASLEPSDRAYKLRESWIHLKARHGMADLYACMYTERG
jgi:hypothetical protein